ncbi:MAG: SpoIIE family protein phosphatase [Polyangiaceae bacterium]|nr:SpoIIE family protein phosphatase [Polyangiaceae bacterium]
MVAVAGGVGAMGAGARAASLVIGRVGNIVQRAVDLPDGGRAVARLLAELDPDIEADLDAGEATAVVVAIGRLDISGASCGDSSAWFVTADRVNELTEYQHRKRRIGSGLALPVSFKHPLQPGWLVVGTDALFDHVRGEKIVEALNEGPADPARALIQLAQGRTGRLMDDITVVVVRVG